MFAILAFVVLSLGAPLATPLDGPEEQYAFIAGLAEKGMNERVVKEAQSFLEQYPRHEKANAARYRLACALFELHDTQKASSEFQRLASLRGFEFETEVLFRLGQCDLEAGDCAGAEAAFRKVVDSKKDYLAAPARWLLGESQLRCEHYDAAEASYRAALAADSGGKYAGDSIAGLAWCAFKRKQFEPAADRARSYLDKFPKGERADELKFLLGESLLELKQPRPALDAYSAVGRGKWTDGALRGAGFARAALGDHAEAAKCFARVPADFPDSRYAAECALHGGIEWIAAGDPAQALALLKSRSAGESVDVLTWRARAERAAGDSEAALKSLDRALALAKDAESKERVHSARADVLQSLGKKDEALREYERAGSDYALEAAAVAALQAGRTADARREAQELLEKYPQSAYRSDATMVAGEALLAEKQFAAAAKTFESALGDEQDAKKRLRCRSRIAWCRYLGDDKPGAAAAFAELARETGDAPEIEEAAFMTGRALEAAGDAQRALQAYEQTARAFPKGPHAEEALFRTAKLDAGPRRLQAFVRDHGDGAFGAQARYEWAERLSAAGKLAEAAAAYRELLQSTQDPALSAAGKYGLAWCLDRTGDAAGAAEVLRGWIADASGDSALRTSALELLVWCEAELKPPEGVAPAWRALLSACDDDARLLRSARSACESLRKAERFPEALAMLDALQKRSKDPKVLAPILVERVYVELDRKNLDQAERALARAITARKEDAGVAEAAFFVGEARLEKGDAPRAVELYEFAAQSQENPARDRALYKAGFARLKAGDAAGAEASFADVVAHFPQSEVYPESLFLLGESQYRQKKYDEACANLERVRKETPDGPLTPKILFRLGLARCEKEDWPGAIEALTKLARTKPDFENLAEAELARGRALAHLNRSREAQSAFERTLALDQGVLAARAHLELGRMHLAAKAYDPALSEFLKVAVLFDLPEETPQALLGAGQALEAQGDSARAIQQYKEVVEKYGKSEAASAAKQRLRELQEKEKKDA
jgi:TolA-binding protein